MKVSFLTFTLLAIGVLAYSQKTGTSSVEFSVSAGTILPGKVKASYESYFPDDQTVDIENKVSPLLKLVADYPLIYNLTVGVNVNLAKFHISDILFDGESMKEGNEVYLGTWHNREHTIVLDDIKMLETNLSVKWKFRLTDNMVLKPCLYAGYRRTFSSSPDGEEQGMVLNYNVEYQYYLSASECLIVELGMLAQPYGGVEHVGYVRTPGVPYGTIGLGCTLN